MNSLCQLKFVWFNHFHIFFQLKLSRKDDFFIFHLIYIKLVYLLLSNFIKLINFSSLEYFIILYDTLWYFMILYKFKQFDFSPHKYKYNYFHLQWNKLSIFIYFTYIQNVINLIIYSYEFLFWECLHINVWSWWMINWNWNWNWNCGEWWLIQLISININ
jgi:hypothetical protein